VQSCLEGAHQVVRLDKRDRFARNIRKIVSAVQLIYLFQLKGIYCELKNKAKYFPLLKIVALLEQTNIESYDEDFLSLPQFSDGTAHNAETFWVVHLLCETLHIESLAIIRVYSALLKKVCSEVGGNHSQLSIAFYLANLMLYAHSFFLRKSLILLESKPEVSEISELRRLDQGLKSFEEQLVTLSLAHSSLYSPV